MKVIRVSFIFMVSGFCILQASKRALEYERAYSNDAKERVTSFYNRLKAAFGFTVPAQPRPRIAEYEKAYAAQAVPDIEIIKKEDYYDDKSGIDRLLAKTTNQKIGEITYSPAKCWINYLSVNPEHQKKKIGSKLFKSAVDQMKDCEEIRWWATPSSVPFYHKQGAKKGRYQETSLYQNMILDKTGGRGRIKRNFVDRPW